MKVCVPDDEASGRTTAGDQYVVLKPFWRYPVQALESEEIQKASLKIL